MDILASIDNLESTLASAPDNEDARWLLSQLYLALANTYWRSYNGEQGPEYLDQPISIWTRIIELKANRLESFNDQKFKIDFIEAHFQMALALHLQSKQEAAIEVIKKALKLQEEEAKDHPLGNLGIRFLQTRSCTLSNIGHLVNEPEFFTKMGILGLRPEHKGILLADPKKVVNRAALEYWRRYLCVVTDLRLIKRFETLAPWLEYNTFWISLPTGEVFYFWSGLNAVQREWEKQKKGPLVKISDNHIKMGRDNLAKLGMPRDAWFITVHARDQSLGKNGQIVDVKPTAHRDCDILSFRLAMEAIVERGGWVIRMGDISMKPLPKMKNVIDYPHCDFRSDWMDLFCVGTSRFFLGTASGLNGVPINFGVPSILTNVSPMNIFPLCKGDLFIPKLLRRISDGKILSFKEALVEPFNHCFNSNVYLSNGVEWIDNTPEELREITLEMLDATQNQINYSEEDNLLQDRFQQLAKRLEPHGLGARIGRDFIRRHKSLLIQDMN